MRIIAIKIPSEPVNPHTFNKLATLIDNSGRERLKRLRLPKDALCSLIAQLTVTWYLYTNGLIPRNKLPTFDKRDKGKPVLSTPVLEPRLEFNNTHDGLYVLFATFQSASPLACVGIDIMKCPDDPFATQEGISDQFTLLEKQSFAVPMSKKERSAMLAKLWSIKEAYTKAIQEGITFGLDRIEVVLEDGEVRAIKVDGKDADKIGWEWRIGQLEKEYRWAVWWRGQDIEGKRNAEIEHISWEEFCSPLLQLANDISSMI
ncbi:hypothetical protein L204_101969 [Cryptococcus depauperatus]|nr:4'-phosphopantetheinyl transferase [Cryptococcus depauperatus CBS 7855]